MTNIKRARMLPTILARELGGEGGVAITGGMIDSDVPAGIPLSEVGTGFGEVSPPKIPTGGVSSLTGVINGSSGKAGGGDGISVAGGGGVVPV